MGTKISIDMELIVRDITEAIKKKIQPNKVVMIFGARRVGKTVLVQHLLNQISEPVLRMNGDDIHSHDRLAEQSVENYRQLIGSYKMLFIDEAQKILGIGSKLKLMVDELPGLKIIVTGSSSFDMDNNVGEPLTGRKHTFNLYGLSEHEYIQVEDGFNRLGPLKERLIYGGYPELMHLRDQVDKVDYLSDMLSSYLLKDILAHENIKNSQKIFNLLRLLAFQLGSEVSLQELGKQLGLHKQTVEKYLDLLTKVFVLHKVEGFSRNLRKEITKSSKWYFLDNGIRNAIIANFNPIESRDDVGALWENYMISERLKYQEYRRKRANNYFWRTYDKQEIDWVEERSGRLYGYEFKWQEKKHKVPSQWKKMYSKASYQVIHQGNYWEWLTTDSETKLL